MGVRRSLLLLVVLAAGLSSRQAVATGSVDDLLAEARARYAELDFAGAGALLAGALDLEMASDRRSDRLLPLLELLGAALVAQNRIPEAVQAYRDLLLIDPGRRLDCARESPRICDVFRRALEESERLRAVAPPVRQPEPEPPVVPPPPEARVYLIEPAPRPAVWAVRFEAGADLIGGRDRELLRHGIALSLAARRAVLPVVAVEARLRTTLFLAASGGGGLVIYNALSAGLALMLLERPVRLVATPSLGAALFGDERFYERFGLVTGVRLALEYPLGAGFEVSAGAEPAGLFCFAPFASSLLVTVAGGVQYRF